MYSSSQYIFTFIYVLESQITIYRSNIVPKVVVIQITLHRLKVVKEQS